MPCIQKPISLIGAFGQELVSDRNASCLVYGSSSATTYWQIGFGLSQELLTEQLAYNNNLLEHNVGQLKKSDQNYIRDAPNMFSQ